MPESGMSRLTKSVSTLKEIQEDTTFLEIALGILERPDGEDASKVKEVSFLLKRFIKKEDNLSKLKDVIDDLALARTLIGMGRD